MVDTLGEYRPIVYTLRMTALSLTFSAVATVSTLAYFTFSAFQTRTAALSSRGHEKPTAFLPIMATYIKYACAIDAESSFMFAVPDSTVFWFKYGFILGDVAMTVVNGVGMLCAMYAGLVHYRHTPHRTSCEVVMLLALTGILIWLGSIAAGVIKLDGVGFSAMAASVVMFAAPLVALVHIVQHRLRAGETPRGVERRPLSIWLPRAGLSLPMIAVTMLLSVSWVAYGLSIADAFVVIPNGLGVLLTLLQLAVWAVSSPVDTHNSSIRHAGGSPCRDPLLHMSVFGNGAVSPDYSTELKRL